MVQDFGCTVWVCKVLQINFKFSKQIFNFQKWIFNLKTIFSIFKTDFTFSFFKMQCSFFKMQCSCSKCIRTQDVWRVVQDFGFRVSWFTVLQMTLLFSKQILYFQNGFSIFKIDFPFSKHIFNFQFSKLNFHFQNGLRFKSSALWCRISGLGFRGLRFRI